MSKLLWDEAIKAEKKRVEAEYDEHQESSRYGRLDSLVSVLLDIQKRLDADPPPVVEAFAWTDSYGELQIQLKAVSPAETFPPMRADKKRRFMLFEIPEHWKIPEEWK